MNFSTATEAYTFIMGKVSEANQAGNSAMAREWSKKVTPALRRAYEKENRWEIASRSAEVSHLRSVLGG